MLPFGLGLDDIGVLAIIVLYVLDKYGRQARGNMKDLIQVQTQKLEEQAQQIAAQDKQIYGLQERLATIQEFVRDMLQMRCPDTRLNESGGCVYCRKGKLFGHVVGELPDGDEMLPHPALP